MTIEVYSFDFDGCLFHVEYLDSKERDILAANKTLFDAIAHSENRKFVFIGSNRQSLSDDYANAARANKGSCYPAIQLVSAALGAEFDNFLMSDLYNDLRAGTAFKKALKCINKSNYDQDKVDKIKKVYNWIHDTGKLTILYAQIHKIASKNPKEAIEFNFYDDKTEILDALHAYFNQYPELIPQNVTLRLQRYMGPTDLEYKPCNPLIYEYPLIKGTRAEPDLKFRKTVKSMAAATIEKMINEGIDIASSKSVTGSVKNYSEAKQVNFAISSIDCIRYYKPESVTPIAKEPHSAGSTIKSRVSSLGNRIKSSKRSASSSPNTTPKPSPNPSPIPEITVKKSSSSNTENDSDTSFTSNLSLPKATSLINSEQNTFFSLAKQKHHENKYYDSEESDSSQYDI